MTMRTWAGAARSASGRGCSPLASSWHRSPHSLLAFYIAMVFIGAGYSFTGQRPGGLSDLRLVRGPRRADDRRLYDAGCGRRGGRPVDRRGDRAAGRLRGHWQAMAWIAVALLVLSFAFIRDAKVPDAPRTAGISGVPCSARNSC